MNFAGNTSLTKCNESMEALEFNKNIYYEASVELITKNNEGLVVGSWFYPNISITLLNPSANFSYEVFEFFVTGPSGERYHQSFPVFVSPRQKQSFMLPDPVSGNPSGWEFDQAGSYEIKFLPQKNIQENNRIFIEYDEECNPHSPSSYFAGNKRYAYYHSFDAQPSYQKEFNDWQKQTKEQDNRQSEFMKNLTVLQTNLSLIQTKLAEKSVGLTWVSLLLATGALFLTAIQTITKIQFPKIQPLELIFMDITIICFLLAIFIGSLVLIFEIVIDRTNFAMVSVGGIISYYFLIKPHLSKPPSSNSPKQ